jgi:hypothetical protein
MEGNSAACRRLRVGFAWTSVGGPAIPDACVCPSVQVSEYVFRERYGSTFAGARAPARHAASQMEAERLRKPRRPAIRRQRRRLCPGVRVSGQDFQERDELMPPLSQPPSQEQRDELAFPWNLSLPPSDRVCVQPEQGACHPSKLAYYRRPSRRTTRLFGTRDQG